jgi:ATP-dependent RNA helicase DDX19/DBP5
LPTRETRFFRDVTDSIDDARVDRSIDRSIDRSRDRARRRDSARETAARAMSTWADDDGDLPPPPGFEDVRAGAHAAEIADIASQLGGAPAIGTRADAVDAPDVALKSEGLREEHAGEVVKAIVDPSTPYASAKSFEDLGLSAELLRGLYGEMKFEKPSKIQAETLPLILMPPHRNLIAQAHNGSGKTTCFTLGMLSRIDPNLKAPQGLMICPTRELVVQNVSVMERMGKYTGVTIASTADPKWDNTNRNKIVDQAVIGTPGKILRWMRERQLACNNMRILVFDEADHMMATDGHRVDSTKILKHLSMNAKAWQVLLFSATFNEAVKSFATKVVPNANQIFIPATELSLDVIKQHRVAVNTVEAKDVLLKEKIFPLCDKIGQTIIFVRTREGARRLHASMNASGYKCTVIEGQMEHADRDRVVKEFRDGLTKILIATDVLSRGLDVSTVTLVINYDMPVEFHNPRSPNYETYLHRIGRSGRFGKKGAAFNLILGDSERAICDQIELHFNHKIPEVAFNDDVTFEKVLEDAGLMSKEEAL